jgi:hypothetical protein
MMFAFFAFDGTLENLFDAVMLVEAMLKRWLIETSLENARELSHKSSNITGIEARAC